MHASCPPRVILAVNGPGELAGWAFPLIDAFKRVRHDAAVCVALLPCVYATGTERAVAAGFPGVDAVAAPAGTMRWITRGVVPAGFEQAQPTALLHLGGEPVLTLLLARRLRCSTAAYLEGPLPWVGRFDRVFARDVSVAARVRCRTSVVGDLVVDAARLRCPVRRPPARGTPPVIGLFPGSRPSFYKHMLPFFLRVAGLANGGLPGARWMIARPGFVSDDALADAASDAAGRAIEGDSARIERGHSGACFVTDSGLRVDLCQTGDVLAQATAALTLPGTSTAELAALGIPMVACAPTYKLDEVPLPGLFGHIDRIPVLGRAMKHGAVRFYGWRLGYLAHPNRRTGRRVVPEAIGRITAHQVAGMLVDLVTGKTIALEQELFGIMGPPGAAATIARDLLGELTRPSAP